MYIFNQLAFNFFFLIFYFEPIRITIYWADYHSKENLKKKKKIEKKKEKEKKRKSKSKKKNFNGFFKVKSCWSFSDLNVDLRFFEITLLQSAQN